MAKGGRYLQTKKKGGWGKRILVTVLVLILLLAGGGIAAGVVYYNSMLNLVTRPEEEVTENILTDEQLEQILGYVPDKIRETSREETEVPVQTEPEKKVEDNIVNIMLIGQQARGTEVAKLSDTMILCSINKDTNTVTLTSFLRDLYIQLPDFQGHVCGKNRINVAYNLGWNWAGEKGGMQMLDQLIQENFGVEVDYNVEVGFEAFTKVIDVLGGVDVELTTAEASYMRLGAEGGTYHLDGETALDYARLRSIDNDMNRSNRQRTLITNLLNKCRSMSITDLHEILKQILPLVITDMTNEEITACAMELLPMLTNLKIESMQCPAEGTYWFDMLDIIGVESSVIKCDIAQNAKLLQAVAEPPAAE